MACIASCAACGRWSLDPHGHEIGAAGSRPTAAGETAHAAAQELQRATHRTLAKVTEDHADFRWNTMISALMELTNRM